MNNLDTIQSKILDWQSIKPHLTRWNFLKNKVVFTNGCFDLLHRGHIDYLAKAADLGDILIVGLNSDISVRTIKGDKRPVTDETSRAWILASLKMVSAVILFDEDTPYELIKRVQPDILVKGNDYAEDEIVGADIVKANGGQIKTMEFLEGYSTSNIIDRIKK